MKTKEFDKPLYLNLYNFNTLAAQDYPYVLTSPRSLEACRKAGCKPVELLYKSLQEYQDDLGAENSSEAYRLYAEQERDRLNKLETCRSIRKELMTQSGPLKENAPPPSSSEVQKKIKNVVSSSSRKEQLDKENTSRAAEKKVSALKTLENNQSNDLKHERSDVLCLTGGGGEITPTSDSTNKRDSTSTPLSTNRSLDVKSCKKSIRSRKSFPAPPQLVSTLHLQTGSSSSEISSISSTSTLTKPNKRNLRQTRNHRFGKPCSRASSRCLQNIASFPSSASSQGANKVQNKCPNSIRKWSPRDRRTTFTTLDSNQTSSSSSRNSSATPSKRKQVSFSYISTDDLCLSEHDRRILESMALKKEIERANDEFAYQAHQIWEQDREDREQQSNEQMARWREYVTEKRRLENIENSRKMEEMKQSLRQSQKQLERRIHEKEARAARLRRAVEERKMSEVEERSLYVAKRRAEVEAAHQQMELEAALWQQSLEEHHKLKLEKAESTRMRQKETYRRRVASANRVEELRHQERWQQVQEETKAALQELRRLCQQREQRAQEKYKQVLHDRNRQLKGQSLERSIKFEQAHHMQDDLELGLKKWQDQVSALQWESTHKAEAKATRHLESKRQKVETENRARMLHHSHLMDRISRQDEARVKYIRDLIARKEAKMQRMAQERDMAIRESRLQAQTTADLREHIRRTLSPETFDRKVARVALETRVAGRPPTASPPMTRSHIFLG